MRKFICFMIVLAGCFCMGAEGLQQELDHLKALEKGRNFKEAVSVADSILSRKDCPPEQLREALELLGICLERLNRYGEIDGYYARILEGRELSWKLYWQLGKAYGSLRNYGYMTAGQFRRGYLRSGAGRWISVAEHDRRQVLHWYELSRRMLQKENRNARPEELDAFYGDFSRALQPDGSRQVWKRWILTDLETVPAWEEVPDRTIRQPGVPSDAQGNPVFLMQPRNFETAANDGERVLDLRRQRQKLGGKYIRRVLLEQAEDSWSIYGVQTMHNRRPFSTDENNADRLSRIALLKKLGDRETVVRLTSGIRKITLPDRLAYIPLYQRAAEEFGDPEACLRLVDIYLNRCQPEQALKWCLTGLKKSEKKPDVQRRLAERKRQLTENFCRLQPFPDILPADKENRIFLQYRNAGKVYFSLEQADSAGLLKQLQQELLQPQAGGRRRGIYGELALNEWFQEKSPYRKFLHPYGQDWTADLPEKIPYLARIVELPLPRLAAGIYLLTARVEGGGVSRMPLIVSGQRILVKELLDGQLLWQVLEAESGRPVAFRNLNFTVFGYHYEHEDGKHRRHLEKRNFAVRTDGSGAVLMNQQLRKQFRHLDQCFCYGTDGQGRFFFSALRVDLEGRRDRNISESEGAHDHVQGILVTDRPLYRPGQQVQMKIWLQNATWKTGAVRRFGRTKIEVFVRNPEGKIIWSSGKGKGSRETDVYGGWESSLPLPADGRLGRYSVFWKTDRDEVYLGAFQVEEYRKPEFEVKISGPDRLPLLGGVLPVKIRSDYYFGEPVRAGAVQVRILRYDHRQNWWPAGEWDWLYGRGYAWLQKDRASRPGAERIENCFLPPYGGFSAPEVILEIDQKLNDRGELDLKIDTSSARQLFGDRDHRYEITVSVRDASQLTVSARRDFVISRRKFRVRAWADCGFSHTGEEFTVRARAVTAEGHPVPVRAVLKIFRQDYDEQARKIREDQIDRYRVESDEDGRLEKKLTLKHAGQYRFEWNCADEETEISGSMQLHVYGNLRTERNFRYGSLELVADKAEYRPGETVRLRINSDFPDSFVLLFLRSRNGLYSRPVYLQLLGRSMEYPVPVTAEDYPNFHIEAGMVRNGRWYQAHREIAVPPASRRLSLEILPGNRKLKPGEKTELRIRVTDHQGRPFRGALALTVYDKSVEAVVGKSNVPEIFPMLWNWKNHYHHRTGLCRWRAWEIRFADDPEPMRPTGCPEEEAWQAHFGGAECDGVSAPMLGAVRNMKGSARSMANSAMAAEEMGQAPAVSMRIRRNFADTAFWQGSLVTDEDGQAVLPVTFPDSLTTWKIRGWAMGEHAQAGQGEAEVITSRDLMIRLTAPRFFTEKDEILLKAVVHNRKQKALQVQTTLQLPDSCLVPVGGEAEQKRGLVPPSGEAVFSWRVRAAHAGTAVVRVITAAAGESDGLEMRLPVQEHGFLQKKSFSGMLEDAERERKLILALPEQSRPESRGLEIAWTPLLAAAVAEAIPGLMANPVASTEGILNSFLPSWLLDCTLRKRGLSLEKIAGAGKLLNSSARTGGENDRYPGWLAAENYSAAALRKASLEKLRDILEMQCADGGWGWFRGYGEASDAYMTSLMVHGLLRAAETGLLSGEDRALQRGLAWLQSHQAEKLRKIAASLKPGGRKAVPDHLDALVHLVLSEGGRYCHEMGLRLFAGRRHLSTYTIACLAMAEVRCHPSSARLTELMRNLRQFLKTDGENQTAWLEEGQAGGWWHWYRDDIETQALYLQLLVRTGQVKSPAATGLVKYLLNHRRNGGMWRSSRDTSRVVEALCDYLQQTEEGLQKQSVEILLDARTISSVRMDGPDFAEAERRLKIGGEHLTPGRHEITLRKSGAASPLYFSAWLDYFSQEDRIPAAGLEVRIQRRLYRLRKLTEKHPAPDARGRLMSYAGERYLREPLAEDAVLQPGELLEAELILDSRNDYDYLQLEDFRAAGIEPVDQRSGYTGNSLGAYMEFRDNRVVMYLPRLVRGQSSVRYLLRAVQTGRYHALPARIRGVYAPELYGNSEEMQMRIGEEKILRKTSPVQKKKTAKKKKGRRWFVK